MLCRLLRNGYSPKEISAATKSATTIRQERAATLTELRSMMQLLTLQSSPASRDTSTTTSVSPTANTSRSAVNGDLPQVMMGSRRPKLQGHNACRWSHSEPQRRRRTRLPHTSSPLPLQSRAQPNKGKTKRQSLSPLRTKTKLYTKSTTSAIPEQSFDNLSPRTSPYPPRSPSLPSNTNELECGVFLCASTSMKPSGHASEKRDEGEEHVTRIVMISPMKKLTPIKRTPRIKREGFDRPLIMPKRWRTPSPQRATCVI
jgi:hypothetical protein